MSEEEKSHDQNTPDSISLSKDDHEQPSKPQTPPLAYPRPAADKSPEVKTLTPISVPQSPDPTHLDEAFPEDPPDSITLESPSRPEATPDSIVLKSPATEATPDSIVLKSPAPEASPDSIVLKKPEPVSSPGSIILKILAPEASPDSIVLKSPATEASPGSIVLKQP
ncbi:MAG: hypothetical protein LBF38_12810, partial [Deltaproteobacteria bacterium]|nr:hypothetical protein [Deltaproteobacteria bacterium]